LHIILSLKSIFLEIVISYANMMRFLFVSFILVAAAAQLECSMESPITDNTAAPVVTIQNGTVVGTTSGAVDIFLGIPYAQPPVGALRLRPPESINHTYGILNATLIPTACPQMSQPQFNGSALPPDLAALLESVLAPSEPEGEDCLNLNIYRPSHVDACSQLPVALWIYGGGFEFGSIQGYNATALVTKSIQLGQPMMFVAMNYRLGGFGFLPGREIQNDGSTNLGLRDQRLAMQWVSENIEKFGGDPSRVTIMVSWNTYTQRPPKKKDSNCRDTYRAKAPVHSPCWTTSSSTKAITSITASRFSAEQSWTPGRFSQDNP
jgi:hypothetical protein